ncbi:MAG: ATP-binding protein, partial [Acidobacteriota bacterium]
RGLRLTDRKPAEQIDEADPSTRRGWGMKLIEKLMDEVHIDHTDDGTSISMTKYLTPEEVPA